MSAGEGAGKECDGSTPFVAHESDCNKYYTCQHGQLLMLACPDKLYWSGDHCDWPENAKCSASSGPDGIPTTPATEPAQPEPEQPAQPEPPMPATEVTERPGKPGKPSKPSEPGAVKPIGNSDYKVVCYFTNWAWYR